LPPALPRRRRGVRARPAGGGLLLGRGRLAGQCLDERRLAWASWVTVWVRVASCCVKSGWDARRRPRLRPAVLSGGLWPPSKEVFQSIERHSIARQSLVGELLDPLGVLRGQPLGGGDLPLQRVSLGPLPGVAGLGLGQPRLLRLDLRSQAVPRLRGRRRGRPGGRELLAEPLGLGRGLVDQQGARLDDQFTSPRWRMVTASYPSRRA
jgi:hypothetical protein